MLEALRRGCGSGVLPRLRRRADGLWACRKPQQHSPDHALAKAVYALWDRATMSRTPVRSSHHPGDAYMELKNYYFILGVPRTATARDILHAYRELAKLYHPDRVGPQGTATFQDIVEAYEVLSDPERRRHYTDSLSQFVDVTASAPPVGSARPEPLIPAQRRFRLYSQPEPL